MLALDTGTDPPALFVPRAPLVVYLRDVGGRADPSDVRGWLELAGWQWADLERRLPGKWREYCVRGRVWIVPVDWPLCTFELAEGVDDARDARVR